MIPQPGIDPSPLQWNLRVFTTGSPGKFPRQIFKTQEYTSTSVNRRMTSSHIWKPLENSAEHLQEKEGVKGQMTSWYYFENSFDSWTPCKGLGDPQGLGSHLGNCCCMLFPLNCCDLLTSSSFSFAINVFPSPFGYLPGAPSSLLPGC